ALRAEGARVPDQAGAVLALLDQQLAAGGGGPERRGLRVNRWGWSGQVAGHASSCPRMSVALPIRVPIEPPVPCTRAMSQSGTCTGALASPRSWRTASITFVIPPRFTGWLLQRPPPSVLNGSAPCGASSEPSATNGPPSPFSQKPRSSIVSSTVMVNES